MVRNSNEGISNRKTRLERSLTPPSLIQLRRPANQPRAMSRKTGVREATTGVGGDVHRADGIAW